MKDRLILEKHKAAPPDFPEGRLMLFLGRNQSS